MKTTFKKLILIFFFLIIAFSVNAVTIPELRGHINDYANILDSRAAQIDQRLIALENETTVQTVILTITALPEDYTIEEYSIKVAEAWQLGQKGKDNGVLITVALNDHKMRIEVGYGLEGVLTDAQAKLIISRKMTPKFRQNDYTGGLLDAVNDICGLITGDEALKEAYNPPSVQINSVQTHNENDINVVVGFIIFIIIFLLLMLTTGTGCSIICGLFVMGMFKELVGGGDWVFIPIIAALIGLFMLRAIVRKALFKTRKGKKFIEFTEELSSAIFSAACSNCLIGGFGGGGGGYSSGGHSGGGGGWSSGGGSHYSGGGGHFGGGGASGGW